MNTIPPLDLRAELAEIRGPLKKRIDRVFKSGRYILGPEVEEFERRFAQRIGTRYAVGIASGTDALLLSLMAYGIKAGDEIITTPFTFIATATSIVRLGAKPVFVDIEPDTCNIDPHSIERKITRKTRGIVAVHLYGNPCRMDEIQSIAKRHGLFVIEDCAQACGATYKGKPVGSLGNTGAFSFYPTKTLGAAGDAGIVTTSDKKIYAKIKSLRHHGDDGRHHAYSHVFIGINSRLDELQAAVLNVKLKFLPKWNEKRRKAAEYYNRLFRQAQLVELKLPVETLNSSSVYHQYVLRVRNGKRDQFLVRLRQAGIHAAVYYPLPLHLQPCFGYLGYKKGDFPVTEQASKQVLSIPLYPQINQTQQKKVVNTLFQI